MSEPDRKVAIITGGSQGIGAGLVAAYRQQGWAVVAVSRTIAPAEDPAVLAVSGDVTQRATIDRMAENASGASWWRNRKLPVLTRLALHPAAGAGSTTPAGTAVEKSSTSAPPGVPVAGSSALPRTGKGTFGSLETKTSFSVNPDDRRRTSFSPSMGRSSASTEPAPASHTATTYAAR